MHVSLKAVCFLGMINFVGGSGVRRTSKSCPFLSIFRSCLSMSVHQATLDIFPCPFLIFIWFCPSISVHRATLDKFLYLFLSIFSYCLFKVCPSLPNVSLHFSTSLKIFFGRRTPLLGGIQRWTSSYHLLLFLICRHIEANPRYVYGSNNLLFSSPCYPSFRHSCQQQPSMQGQYFNFYTSHTNKQCVRISLSRQRQRKINYNVGEVVENRPRILLRYVFVHTFFMLFQV